MNQYCIQTTDAGTFEFRGDLIAQTGNQVEVAFYGNATVPNTNLFHSAKIFKTESGRFVVVKRFFANYRDWDPGCNATDCNTLDEALDWLRDNDDEQGLAELLKYE
jgi:hypothetical protein